MAHSHNHEGANDHVTGWRSLTECQGLGLTVGFCFFPEGEGGTEVLLGMCVCGGLALAHANAYQLEPVYGMHLLLIPSSAMRAETDLAGREYLHHGERQKLRPYSRKE